MASVAVALVHGVEVQARCAGGDELLAQARDHVQPEGADAGAVTAKARGAGASSAGISAPQASEKAHQLGRAAIGDDAGDDGQVQPRRRLSSTKRLQASALKKYCVMAESALARTWRRRSQVGLGERLRVSRAGLPSRHRLGADEGHQVAGENSPPRRSRWAGRRAAPPGASRPWPLQVRRAARARCLFGGALCRRNEAAPLGQNCAPLCRSG